MAYFLLYSIPILNQQLLVIIYIIGANEIQNFRNAQQCVVISDDKPTPIFCSCIVGEKVDYGFRFLTKTSITS